MEKKVLPDTYQKYGYKMFDCSISEIKRYQDECYNFKKTPMFNEKFSYVTFIDVNDAVKKIREAFIPIEHGNLPKVKWSLAKSKQLLIKELWYYNYNDRKLYQCAVERAWALGGQLDIRVEQHYYG